MRYARTVVGRLISQSGTSCPGSLSTAVSPRIGVRNDIRIYDNNPQ